MKKEKTIKTAKTKVIGDGKNLCVLAICTLTQIQSQPYATHLQFAYRLAKDNPDWSFILFTPYRMQIARFRNMAAEAALNQNAEYLMFIDDDAILIDYPDIFNRLKERDKHIIAPLMYIRGYPFDPMFFKYVRTKDVYIKGGVGLELYKDFKTDGKIQDDGLLPVAAIGCHVCLIKTEVFKNMEQPYFMTGMNNTEDVFFCMKCHDCIENIEIFIDTKLSVGHLLLPIWVNDYNVDILRKFYEELKLDVPFKFEQEYADFPPEMVTNELEKLGEDFEE